MSNGHIQGQNLICGLHNWDYRLDSGVSEYEPSERLHKFKAVIHESDVYVDESEVLWFEDEVIPSPFNPEEYLGEYADTHPESTETYTRYIKHLAQNGLTQYGHHGATDAMGVDRNTLPKWEDIQFLPAQLAKKPLLDHEAVATKIVIGPNAKRPLELEIPVFVSDMSYDSLSREAKISLAKGAEMSGTGGHLPGYKVVGEIAKVRGLPEGKAAISPATFADLRTPEDFRNFANEVRTLTGGIPIGIKMSANRLEADLDFALEVGVDYIILDGRGGGTGAAPIILRNHISVPTIPALARARKHLDKRGAKGVTLIATQKPNLRARLMIQQSAKQLHNFFEASKELMQVVARACGHDDINKFCQEDITTFNYEMYKLTGIQYAGIG